MFSVSKSVMEKVPPRDESLFFLYTVLNVFLKIKTDLRLGRLTYIWLSLGTF